MKHSLKQRNFAFFFLVAVLLIGFVGVYQIYLRDSPSSKSSPEIHAPGYVETNCWFDIPDNREIQCGHFHTDTLNSSFVLPVVIIKDHNTAHKAEPIVYLSGGPGGASGLNDDDIENWYYWVDEQNLQRDLILVDQRGVGLSTPLWKCDEYRDYVRDTLKRVQTLEEESGAAYQAVSDCLDTAERRGMTPSFFSTTNSARDMAQLMKQLNYSRWHVLGVSHGTRIALEWARRFPQGIESLILDSVYPLDKGVLSEWPQLLDDSFERFWNLCERDDVCEQSYSPQEVKALFWQSLETVKDRPISLTVDSWWGDWPYNIVVSDHRLLAAMYSAMYESYWQTHMLKALQEIHNGGDYPFLTLIMEQSVNSEVDPNFNLPVYFAVECSETPELNADEYETERQKFSQWSAYTAYDWSIDICTRFEKREDLNEFKQPVQTTIPALILAGELDPVTPASWARDLHARLPNSQLLEVPNVGHGVTSTSTCRNELLAFLNNPAQELSIDCVD